jgi:methionyl-tRNA formyltransferase
MNIGLLLSGNLGYECLQNLYTHFKIKAVLTDKLSGDIITLAAKESIPFYAGNPRNGESTKFLSKNNICLDMIISINYLFFIERDLIEYPKIASVNFHGSLLPRYRGRTPHVWAIINNEKVTGVTAHFIADECDSGPIIDQLEIEIHPLDTGGTLLGKFNSVYPPFVKKTISRFLEGGVIGSDQDHSKATFYGKRTSESGKINWQWQRERIYNWIRAQAHPYPGAYCFYNTAKITIDAIEFCDLGYTFTDPEGLILAGGKNPAIKTPNGAIRIISMREAVDFEQGKILV